MSLQGSMVQHGRETERNESPRFLYISVLTMDISIAPKAAANGSYCYILTCSKIGVLVA